MTSNVSISGISRIRLLYFIPHFLERGTQSEASTRWPVSSIFAGKSAENVWAATAGRESEGDVDNYDDDNNNSRINKSDDNSNKQ